MNVYNYTEDHDIADSLRDFRDHFPYLDIDTLVEYFSLVGGLDSYDNIHIYNDITESIRINIIERISDASIMISPSYLLDNPYRKLLISVARGDGKIFNLFKKANMSEQTGGRVLSHLVSIGVLYIEQSRELPIKRTRGEEIPKELRRYRIQSKVRFVAPFYRFWFGFVEPYHRELQEGLSERFWRHFQQHRSKASYLVFEHLSNRLLSDIYKYDPIISGGGWWDKHHEYDVLAVTHSGRVILGECKYRSRPITKGELTKLTDKASSNGWRIDTFALFSRNGFSKELLKATHSDLLLYDINDFEILLR